MNGYPLVDELEVTIRAGRGVAVIVEGQSAEEDPWFYGQWFDDRARQVTFFPQDGWTRVVEAVAELRRRCPDVPVCGIIDRDFAEDGALDADFASLGILRTSYYTLENYLLEPTCWAQVFSDIFCRQGYPPDSWGEVAQVQKHIEDAYRTCVDLAAHNRVIKYGNDHYPGKAAETPENQRIYREHPDALLGVDVANKLRAWGRQMGCIEDLGDMFENERLVLTNAGILGWRERISGKYVLRVFHRRFPRRAGKAQFDLDYYLNLYLRRCPDPPVELIHIIDRIIADAARPAGIETP